MRYTCNEILIVLVGHFLLLLKRAHETLPRYDILFYLRQMNLHQKTFVAVFGISNLCHSIARSSNADEYFALHSVDGRSHHELMVLHITSCPPCEICLMLFALGVSEVGSLIGVEGEAETTFERAKMVPEDVGVLDIKSSSSADVLVNARFRTLARSIVSSASFLSRSRRSMFVSDAPATPPPPNLDPTRFCRMF